MVTSDHGGDGGDGESWSRVILCAVRRQGRDRGDGAVDGWGSDPVEVDRSVASEARVYDYLLGGVDNFKVDREVAERQGAAAGGIEYARAGVRMNRLFLGQAVRFLAGEAGMRQFLDIGTGIPTMANVHQVAQEVAPESRIVCVDYDPVVLAHAHILMESTPAVTVNPPGGSLSRGSALDGRLVGGELRRRCREV